MSIFLPIDKKDLDIETMEEPTPAERLTVSIQPEFNEAVAELSNLGSSIIFNYIFTHGGQYCWFTSARRRSLRGSSGRHHAGVENITMGCASKHEGRGGGPVIHQAA